MRFPLSFLLSVILTFPLFAESKNVLFGLETIYSELQLLQREPKEIPGWFLSLKKEEEENRYKNRESLPLLGASAQFENHSEWNKTQGLIYIVKGKNEENPRFLLGRNVYTALPLFQFVLGVGRREHIFHTSPFAGFADGTDGVFLERKFGKGILQVSLYDHYSGYKLYEKEIYRNSTSTVEGFRRRHGVGYKLEGDVSFSVGWQIMEPGSFGRLAKENTTKVNEQGGDGDFIHIANLGFQRKWREIEFSTELFYTKGRDRWEGKFLPIQGEAIQLGVNYQGKQIKARWATHVSDDDERKEANEIQKIGYIGTGAHFGSIPFLSQIFQVYPGSWFYCQGLERSATLQQGRAFGFYSEGRLEAQFSVFHLNLFGGYFAPRNKNGISDGRLSLKRENYEGIFLLETGLSLEWKESESYQLGLIFSQLRSDSVSSLEGNFASIYARILL